MTSTAPRTLPAPLVCLVAAIVLAMTTLLAPGASAHSVLVSSDPADGAVLAAVPRAVTLTFNEEVKGQFSKVLVTPPGGKQLTPQLVQHGPVVQVPLPEGLGAGGYRVVYSVVSADTHRISGELSFTVRGASETSGAAVTTPASASPAATPAAAPSTSAAPHSTSAWTWGGPLASLLLLIPVVWAARREARRRAKPRLYHDEDLPQDKRR